MAEEWPPEVQKAFDACVAQMRIAVDARIALGRHIQRAEQRHPGTEVVLRDSFPGVRVCDRARGRLSSLLFRLDELAHDAGMARGLIS